MRPHRSWDPIGGPDEGSETPIVNKNGSRTFGYNTTNPDDYDDTHLWMNYRYEYYFQETLIPLLTWNYGRGRMVPSGTQGVWT